MVQSLASGALLPLLLLLLLLCCLAVLPKAYSMGGHSTERSPFITPPPADEVELGQILSQTTLRVMAQVLGSVVIASLLACLCSQCPSLDQLDLVDGSLLKPRLPRKSEGVQRKETEEEKRKTEAAAEQAKSDAAEKQRRQALADATERQTKREADAKKKVAAQQKAEGAQAKIQKEEAQRKIIEDTAKKLASEEEATNAALEAQRKIAEDEAKKLASDEEAKKAAEEEAARKKASEEDDEDAKEDDLDFDLFEKAKQAPEDVQSTQTKGHSTKGRDIEEQSPAKDRWRKVHGAVEGGAAMGQVLNEVRAKQIEKLYDDNTDWSQGNS